MTAKKVWAVIIIVVGVGFFLNGLQSFFFAGFLGSEIQYMETQASRAGFGGIYDFKRDQRLVQTSRVGAALGSLLGITMAIGGTMWLNEQKKKHVPRNRSRSLDLDKDFPSIWPDEDELPPKSTK
jgi:hypothetical protein